jgi:hypothetical protein
MSLSLSFGGKETSSTVSGGRSSCGNDLTPEERLAMFYSGLYPKAKMGGGKKKKDKRPASAAPKKMVQTPVRAAATKRPQSAVEVRTGVSQSGLNTIGGDIGNCARLQPHRRVMPRAPTPGPSSYSPFIQNYKYGDPHGIAGQRYNRRAAKRKPRPAGFNNRMNGNSRPQREQCIHTHMPNKDRHGTTARVGPGAYKEPAGMGRQIKSQHRAANKVKFGTEHRFRNNFGWVQGTASVDRIWAKDMTLCEQWDAPPGAVTNPY